MSRERVMTVTVKTNEQGEHTAEAAGAPYTGLEGWGDSAGESLRALAEKCDEMDEQRGDD